MLFQKYQVLGKKQCIKDDTKKDIKMTFEEEREYFLRVIDFALLHLSDEKEEKKVSFRKFIADELLKEDSQLYHDSPYTIVAAKCLPQEKAKDICGVAWFNILNTAAVILCQGMEEEPGTLKSNIDLDALKSQIASLFDEGNNAMLKSSIPCV